jgi:hypothetical protein
LANSVAFERVLGYCAFILLTIIIFR